MGKSAGELEQPGNQRAVGQAVVDLYRFAGLGHVHVDRTLIQAYLVLWHNGTVTDLGTLGTPGTWSFTQAAAINNNGQIAGRVDTGGADEGFLYSSGTITSLGTVLAAAINDNGVMVGGPSIDTRGTVQNLNTLIPAGARLNQESCGTRTVRR